MKHHIFSPFFERLEQRVCLTQVGFAVQVFENVDYGVQSVSTADLDGDGDPDILAAFNEGVFVWYENLDGRAQRFDRKPVGKGTEPLEAIAVDIDNDGDLDVAVASNENVLLSWFENLDGRGTFVNGSDLSWGNVVLEEPRALATAMAAGDIDGDGDVDLLASFTDSEDKVAWFENADGKGEFSPERLVGNVGSAAQAIDLADIDGDADLDVLLAMFDDQVIAWHENLDGQGSFGARQVLTDDSVPDVLAFPDVLAADLDQDGDQDVLAALPWQRSIVWYENLDGRGEFDDRQVLVDDVFARAIRLNDVDSDGHLDLVVSESLDDGDRRLTWYERLDDREEFGDRHFVANRWASTLGIHAADIDDDGDLDILMSSTRGDVTVIFEQRLLGDANDNGVFDSSDLVAVFQAGEYEDGLIGNSAFEDGDWDGDGEFDSSDLVLAFQAGHYETAAGPPAAEIAAAVEAVFAESNRERVMAFVA